LSAVKPHRFAGMNGLLRGCADMERTCVICGVGIEHRQKSFLTCTPECSAERRRRDNREKAAMRRAANPEKIKQQRRASYLRNRGKRLAEARQYYRENIDERRAYSAEWNRKNAERKQDYNREYHQRHADKLREKARDRYWTDPDAKKAYNL
jgi:hypothetical protein